MQCWRPSPRHRQRISRPTLRQGLHCSKGSPAKAFAQQHGGPTGDLRRSRRWRPSPSSCHAASCGAGGQTPEALAQQWCAPASPPFTPPSHAPLIACPAATLAEQQARPTAGAAFTGLGSPRGQPAVTFSLRQPHYAGLARSMLRPAT